MYHTKLRDGVSLEVDYSSRTIRHPLRGWLDHLPTTLSLAKNRAVLDVGPAESQSLGWEEVCTRY